MEFIQWLKRIFSVGTISVLIGIVSLVITYLAFFRDSPGNLSMSMKTEKIDDKVSTIYVLTPVGDDGIDFVDQSVMPFLGNLTQRPVLDCTFIMEFYTNNQFELFQEYTCRVDTTKASKPYVEMARKMETIGYMGSESFPLIWFGSSAFEPQMTTFGWTYIHRGMKKPRTYNIRLFTVPERMINDNEDYVFLKMIRPYLLEEKSLKNVAIFYDNILIQGPRNVKKLSSGNIADLKIADLQ